MDKTLNMALVGASGVVGKKILQLLENRGIKVDKFFHWVVQQLAKLCILMTRLRYSRS